MSLFTFTEWAAILSHFVASWTLGTFLGQWLAGTHASVTAELILEPCPSCTLAVTSEGVGALAFTVGAAVPAGLVAMGATLLDTGSLRAQRAFSFTAHTGGATIAINAAAHYAVLGQFGAVVGGTLALTVLPTFGRADQFFEVVVGATGEVASFAGTGQVC